MNKPRIIPTSASNTPYPETPERILSEHDWVYAATLIGKLTQQMALWRAGHRFDAESYDALLAGRAFMASAT